MGLAVVMAGAGCMHAVACRQRHAHVSACVSAADKAAQVHEVHEVLEVTIALYLSPLIVPLAVPPHLCAPSPVC